MFTKFTTLLSVAVCASAAVSALPVPTGSWPASTGLVQNTAPITVAAGEVFDGKMQTYERSDIKCGGQAEGGAKDTVFLVQPGGTLKNVIIGKNQAEGVYCDKHDCTIENVWWDDVCEDALSIKGGSATSVSKVLGGGARYADDKVVQHNGPGKVTIDGFYVEDFGKLYRSCGTCGEYQRTVEISNVLAKNPTSSIATVNSNFGDKATLKNIWIESKKDKVTVCGKTAGGSGGEPTKAGDGADGKVCIYEASDIHINGGSPPSGGDAAPPASSTSPPAAADDGDDAVVTPAPSASDDDNDDNDDNDDDETEAPETTKPPKSKKPKKTKAPCRNLRGGDGDVLC